MSKVPAPGVDAMEDDDLQDVRLLTRLNERGFRLVQGMDAVAVVAILVGAMWVRYGWTWPTYPMGAYAVSFAITAAVFLAALYFGGLYDREPRLGRASTFPRALRLTAGAAGIVAVGNLAAAGVLNSLGYSVGPRLPLPIYVLVTLMLLGAVAVSANRQLTTWNEQRVQGPPRVLLVGTTEELAKAREHLDIDDEAEVVGTSTSLDDLVAEVARTGATDVILLGAWALDGVAPSVLARLDLADVAIHQRVTLLETMYGLQRVRQIGGMPFVRLRAHTLPLSRRRFKRFSDIAWLALLAPVLLLLLTLTALYTLVVARRPILYWQERVGVGGSTFRLVKFRTMRRDAEAVGGAQLAQKEDPRVIPACRWLRATRLDELPQVWNILRGEMSLVGPRPERPELTADFEVAIPGYGRRHELPPGLTGLAQIHGRYHTDPEYKLGYDLQYLVNWSLVLDVEILLRTVWVVVTRRV